LIFIKIFKVYLMNIIEQLTKDHNVEHFINSFNENKENSTDIFTFDLIQLIEEDSLNSEIYKNAIIQLLLNKERINPIYTKSIVAFKKEQNKLLKESHLIHISTQLFTTEYYNHFISLAIGRLLEENLNKKELEEFKKFIFKLHLDTTSKLVSFDSILYANGNFSNTFNYSLYFNLKNLIHCYFGKEILNILILYINSDLLNREFIYKNKKYCFSELKVDYSDRFEILVNIQNSFVNINKVEWIK